MQSRRLLTLVSRIDFTRLNIIMNHNFPDSITAWWRGASTRSSHLDAACAGQSRSWSARSGCTGEHEVARPSPSDSIPLQDIGDSHREIWT